MTWLRLIKVSSDPEMAILQFQSEKNKNESNEKAMNWNWSNQKTNPALKTKMGNNQNHN